MTNKSNHGHGGPVPLSLSAPARIRYYNAPSPRNTNHAQIYIRSDGALIDRRGALWGRASMGLDGKLGYDELPSPAATGEADRGDAQERLEALRLDIEKCMERLDLHEEVKAALFECLNRHVKVSSKRGVGPDARVAKDKKSGRDEEHRGPDLKRIAEFLLQKGFSYEDMAKAVRLAAQARGSGEVEEGEDAASDRLPEPATRGGLAVISAGPRGTSSVSPSRATARRAEWRRWCAMRRALVGAGRPMTRVRSFLIGIRTRAGLGGPGSTSS